MLIVALSACGDDNEPADTTAPATTDATSQLANPASEYCVAQGGTVELVDEADGQVGYCNLPDGRRVEEWEFYNSDNG
jgi:putative hemolysin